MQLLSLACRLHLQQLSEKGRKKCQIKGLRPTNLIALAANTISSNKLQYTQQGSSKYQRPIFYLAHQDFALKLVQFSLHIFIGFLKVAIQPKVKLSIKTSYLLDHTKV